MVVYFVDEGAAAMATMASLLRYVREHKGKAKQSK
jgi:hypothetical protein